MINPSAIDLTTLPWVPLDATAGFPAQPGIYFAIDSLDQIQYIGQTGNVRGRWKNHHRYQDLQKIGGVRVVYLFINEASLLLDIETALIQWFKPPLNKVLRSGSTTARAKEPSKGIKIRRIVDVEVEDLGDRIREARKATKRSVDSLSKTAGISRVYWYDIENERIKYPLPEDTLRAIEKSLDIDLGVNF